MSVTIKSNKKLHPKSQRAFETILKHHGYDKDDIGFMSFGVVECGGTTIVNTKATSLGQSPRTSSIVA